MGFSTGFAGGVTVTLGIAYLTVLQHQRNRTAQGAHLRTQALHLDSLLTHDPTLFQRFPETERAPRQSIAETAKDRWNEEITNAVQWVQNADWEGVTRGLEGAVSRLWSNGLQKSRDGIEHAEETVSPRVREALDRSREIAAEEYNAARVAAERKAQRTLEGLRQGGKDAKSGAVDAYHKFDGQVPDQKTEHGLEHASETIKYATQEAVRKGKEIGQGVKAAGKDIKDAASDALHKAGDIAYAATERARTRQEANDGLTDVQRALKQRYQVDPDAPSTVKEALAARYTPIEKRANNVLRGL